MKHDRPSLRAYRAHLCRQYFGRSLSTKPITGKHGERYAILKNTPYKLLWIIVIPSALIITLINGRQFGFFPLLAVIVLYCIVAAARYFFASFIKLEDSEDTEDLLISYEMCDNASKEVRPEFSSYLKYVFVPATSRYVHLIKDKNGLKYYRIQRSLNNESFLLFVFVSLLIWAGPILGTGFLLSLWLIGAALFLLLYPLSLYYLCFKRTDNQDDTSLQGEKYSSVLYMIVSGIIIAGGLVLLVFTFILIRAGSFKSEEISFACPSSIKQAYDYTLTYTKENLGKADLVDFHIKYDDLNAMRSGEPSSWSVKFQDTPGLLPCPNETMEFWCRKNSNIELYHLTYEDIRPAYDAGLVTRLTEIPDILTSNTEILFDWGRSAIYITTADRSPFKIHDPYECQIEIDRGKQETAKYIVNIRDKTVRSV